MAVEPRGVGDTSRLWLGNDFGSFLKNMNAEKEALPKENRALPKENTALPKENGTSVDLLLG